MNENRKARMEKRQAMKKELHNQEQNKISKLAILLETIRVGSISKAAEELNYTQSGLTYLLNTLEEDLGIPLLKRDYKGVSFTEEGLYLEPYIRALVEKENELQEQINTLLGKSYERIRIGTIHSIANYWLPQIIVEFKKEHPNAHIEFRVGGGAEIPTWVKENKIDIGIADEAHSEGFDWRPIMKEQFYVAIPASWEDITPRNGAIQIDDLVGRPMLFPSANQKNAGARMLKDREIPNKIMVSSADGTTLLSMVESGLGFTLLSQRYIVDCPDRAYMYPVNPPIVRTWGIMADSFKGLRPLAKQFADRLQAHGRLLD